MNGSVAHSRPVAATLSLAGRLAAFRTEGFPHIPVLIILTVVLVAIFASVIAPHNPEVGVLGDRFRPPAWQVGGTLDHLLGTDHLGPDVLSRPILQARVSLILGFTAAIFAGLPGTTLGIISGFLWGLVEQAVIRNTDPTL